MKWFNYDEFFVVVLEDGDVYGPESRRTYSLSEPTIRIFDKTRGFRNHEDYPLLAEWSLSAFKRLSSNLESTELANGQMLAPSRAAGLYKFTHSLLVNAGALRDSKERLAA